MKNVFLIIFFTLSLFNISQGDETSNKQKELETKIKLLEKELEIEKLKKELADQKKLNESEKKENESKKNNEVLKSSNTSQNKDIEKSIIIGDDDVLKEIKLLGSFKEPERYPESFRAEFFKDCEKFSCIGNTSTKKWQKYFLNLQDII